MKVERVYQMTFPSMCDTHFTLMLPQVARATCDVTFILKDKGT